MTNRNLGTGIFAEFLATLLFVIFGVGAVIASADVAVGGMAPSRMLYIALTHGLAIYALVSMLGSVSGGHINPAVTLGVALSGHMSGQRAVAYMIAQFVGAASGAVFLLLFVPGALQAGLGVHGLGAGVTAFSGFVFEAVLTMVLVLTVLMTAVKKNASATLAPLAIGMAVFLGIMVGIPVTGGSMNPARSLGPLFVSFAAGSMVPAHSWVYAAGPAVGSLLAVFLFGRFFRDVSV